MSLEVSATGAGTPTAHVTVTPGAPPPSEGRDRFNGWVMVGGHRTRAYVATWHPQDAGSGRWP